MTPQRLYRSIIICFGLSFGYISYRVYSFSQGVRELHSEILAGTAHAPFQYRFLPHQIADLLQNVGLRYDHSFALTDTASLLIALFIFGRFWLAAAPQAPLKRYLYLFILIATVQYGLLWVIYWHQVPYTLPSLLYVALVLYLFDRMLTRNQSIIPALLLLALTAVQVTIRADIAFAVAVGFALYFLTDRDLDTNAPKWLLISVVTIMGLIALSGQAYLTLWLFPDAVYDVAIVQLVYNLSPARIAPFLLYMVLYGCVVAWWRIRPQSDLFTAIFYGSLLHLLMWVTLGIIDETRIFIPLLLPLAHYAARYLLYRIAP